MEDTTRDGVVPLRNELRLGWFVVGSLVAAAALSLVYYIAEAADLFPRPYLDALSLLIVGVLAMSAWYVVNRVYSVPKITRTITLAATCVIVSQVINVMEEVTLLGSLQQFISDLPFHGFILKNGLVMAGLILFFAGFYLCIFETEAAKNRLRAEAQELEEQIAERKRAEQALRESEQKFRLIAEQALMSIVILQEGRFKYVNPTFATLCEYTIDEILLWSPESLGKIIHPEDRDFVLEQGRRKEAGQTDVVTRYAYRGISRTGKVKWVEHYSKTITYEGKPAVLIAMIDITDRKRAEEDRLRLEAQVQQAQKLESLGVLAGGIAHDFNNLLMGILGNADLALMDLSPVSPARERIQAIESTARRAADLSQQMLAYSGKGRFVVEAIDLSELVAEMGHLLEVSISKKVAIGYHCAENLPSIEADPTQVRQVVMNLITNASEAIGKKNGVISVSTGVTHCDRGYLRDAFLDEDLPEGVYVYLDVSDSGVGMTPETQAKIFDPFFTTKFTGRGLGLAAVLGIMRGHKGAIKVYSEPGRGTTFKVLFPSHEQTVTPRPKTSAAAPAWRGSGTVLLVDDEPVVREVGHAMLEEAGFAVLTAQDGAEAVDQFRQHAEEIVCVLLDLTMPHMDGEETFRELRRIRHDVRVVLSSGYNEVAVVSRFVGKGLAGFIQKPYQSSALIDVLRAALQAE